MNQGEPQPNALLLVRRAINLDERPQPMQVTASFHCNPIPPPLKT